MSNTYNWKDIEQKAHAFAADFALETDEEAEAKTFWDSFFRVIFGVERRKVARFESSVKRTDKNKGFIDLFWKGLLLVEHKSAHKDSEKEFISAYEQALEYFEGTSILERPKFIVICNFKRFRLYDVVQKKQDDFLLRDLADNIQKFQFIPDAAKIQETKEEEVNITAARMLGELHDAIEDKYKGEDLELLLIRILFCLFAEDTGIFKKDIFQHFFQKHTAENGEDLGEKLLELFKILDTPEHLRPKTTPQYFRDFPYVNGSLFKKPLAIPPPFNLTIKLILFNCSKGFDWSVISPAIFGSLFQYAMKKDERRTLGAHYTSEKNIKRLIDPLFMTDLWAQFYAARYDRAKLEVLLKKIARLRFLDPACGCGNFLVVTYKELRLLEVEIIKEINRERHRKKELAFSERTLIAVSLNSFYGIEYDQFSAHIAPVAMWIAEFQMNKVFESEFKTPIDMLPLDDSMTIYHRNALDFDWKKTFKPSVDYIVGNPPFIGKQFQSAQQKADTQTVFSGIKGSGDLDYVACWYLKAADYVAAYPSVQAAFVSTNSVIQGEQVGVLWKEMFEKYKIKIRFAHQTFRWSNEVKGFAAVHCVIVAFDLSTKGERFIFEYEDINTEPSKYSVGNINPYLVEGKDLFVENRRKPIANVPPIKFGNMPNDGGHLLLTAEERIELLKKEPQAARFIKPFVGAHEFINGKERYCLWLVDVLPQELKQMPQVYARVQKVFKHRNDSNRAATNKLAATPALFGEIRQPNSEYILIPSTSSERRTYIPIGFVSSDVIASNACLMIGDANLFHFGILTSKMHMVWVNYICGRLKSDYRYSNEIVYNNFPFPEKGTAAQKTKVEQKAQAVLDIREKYNTTGSNLANLYDPLLMPVDLTKAHNELDKAVDDCYGKRTFSSNAKRLAFLFELYEKLIEAEKQRT